MAISTGRLLPWIMCGFFFFVAGKSSAVPVLELATLPSIQMVVEVSDSSGSLGTFTSTAGALSGSVTATLSPAQLTGLEILFAPISIAGSVISSGSAVSFSVDLLGFTMNLDGFLLLSVGSSAVFSGNMIDTDGSGANLRFRIDSTFAPVLTGLNENATLGISEASLGEFVLIIEESPRIGASRSCCGISVRARVSFLDNGGLILIPEPSAASLVTLGLIGLAVLRASSRELPVQKRRMS